ncbi:Clavaminate synthase-like protein, partial [Nadsonia fulvescens var. elongata DSM 6958]
WIECDGCKAWIHCRCVNMSAKEVLAIIIYHCPDCELKLGPSSKRRVSTRQRQAIDYSLLNEGESLVSRENHIHLDRLHTYPFIEDNLERITGEQLTPKWANTSGLLDPVVIPAEWFDSLDMSYPDDLTVRKVSEIIGHEFSINVMDVPTQQESKGWTLAAWTDYYETPAHLRERVRNVISLEFSQTDLASLVKRPRFVREMDWINQVWPKELLGTGKESPQVSLYCLMSVKDSFTDFHVDFGGSSVFYHVIKGQKVFYFISPLAKNLKVYEAWCLSPLQTSQFLPDLVDTGCTQVTLNKGDSMIIPSGWIHAVYTPADSLVIGGNFLTPVNILTQLKLAKIEQRTKVPQKFRFPHFSKVLWFAVIKYLKVLKNKSLELSQLEQKSLEPILSFLYEDVKLLMT